MQRPTKVGISGWQMCATAAVVKPGFSREGALLFGAGQIPSFFVSPANGIGVTVQAGPKLHLLSAVFSRRSVACCRKSLQGRNS